MENQLKQRIKSGEVSIGSWLTEPSAAIAGAMVSCGFEWLAVDFEHGTADISQVQDVFIAIERYGATPLVRLPSADPFLGRRLLDAGAGGFIVPVVENVAAFTDFISHLYFPPQGRRGVSLNRATVWGDNLDDYMMTFEPVIVPQVETMAGVKVAQQLAQMPEVDALFIGPYDLSASLGVSGDFSGDAFAAAVGKIKSACAEHGKAAGIHQVKSDPAELKQQIDDGFKLIAYGTDITSMRETLIKYRCVLPG